MDLIPRLRGFMTGNKDAHYDKRLGWTMKKGIGKGITEGDKKKMGLTEKQAKFLHIIQHFIQSNGYSPSFEELKQLNGMKSKSNVHAYVQNLKKRGYIDYIAYSNRSIAVL